jgi:UDP-N-acetyl-D-glucosamine dehydrogenase
MLIKIQNKKAKIGIIGLGYVGLPLSLRFVEEGFNVLGFDIDVEKVRKLNAGKTYIKHIVAGKIKTAIKSNFRPTTDFSEIKNVDVVIICVPTPLGIHNEPDLSYIKGTLVAIKPYLQENQLLVLESTTYPGTTEEEILPFIERVSNPSKRNNKEFLFIVGENFFIGYSPEREDPGNRNFTTKSIPKIISGITPNCLELTKVLYSQIVDKTVPVSSTAVAEMTKILENTHRAVNIGLVNELKIVADKMNIDIYEVIKAAATKPFGFTPYYPGPGVGGHCIPIDPFFLTWKAKELKIKTRFIELAGEINSRMPAFVVNKVKEALKTSGKSIKNSKIMVLGLSYKKNVDDARESPSFVIIDMLMKLGAMVEYSDPFFKKAPKTRKYNFKLESISLTKNNIKLFDIIIVATDHDKFNYDMILKEGKLIVDSRGKFKRSNKVFNA